MKGLYTYLFILLLSNICKAQMTEYDFSNFLFPDLQRQTFRITPFVDLDYSKYGNSSRNSNFAGTISGNFNSFNFTRDKQSNTSIFCNLGLRERSTASSILAYDQIFFYFDYKRDNKIYIDNDQFLNFDFSFESDLARVAPSLEREVQFNLKTTPTLGYGRIEVVTDGWHAVALINRLDEEGLLLKELEQEEVTALGRKIAEIKNTRRVDFRHEEKYEREILLDYFVSNGLIDINDYRSITTLIDAWQFEDFITRQHGKTIEYGFEFEYDILDVTAFSIGQRFNSEAITIVFNSKKAKSLKKQIDHTLGVKGGFWNLSPLNDNDINKRNFYQIDYNFNYGYFLSARTNFNLRLNASALGFLKSSETQNSLSVNLRYNYYISPNYRFSIIGQVNTFKQDIRNYNFVNNERTHFAVRLDYFVY